MSSEDDDSNVDAVAQEEEFYSEVQRTGDAMLDFSVDLFASDANLPRTLRTLRDDFEVKCLTLSELDHSNGIPAIKNYVCSNMSLEYLEFSDSNLGETAKIDELFKSLCRNTTIRRLKFHNVRFEESNERALRDLIRRNRSIDELMFTHVNLTSPWLHGCIANGLQRNSNLRALEIHNCSLNEDAIAGIVGAISSKDCTVRKLSLDFACLSAASVRMVLEATKKPGAVLESLEFTHSPLEHEYRDSSSPKLQSLISFLEEESYETTRLRDLYIRARYYRFDPESPVARLDELLRILESNNFLHSLDIGTNNSEIMNVSQLTKSLPKFTTLKCLKITALRFFSTNHKDSEDEDSENQVVPTLFMISSENEGGALVEATNNNTSLFQFELRDVSGACPNRRSIQKIRFYTHRNRINALNEASPELMPPSLWPLLLHKAAQNITNDDEDEVRVGLSIICYALQKKLDLLPRHVSGKRRQPNEAVADEP